MARPPPPVLGQPDLNTILKWIWGNPFARRHPAHVPASPVGLRRAQNYQQLRKRDVPQFALQCEAGLPETPGKGITLGRVDPSLGEGLKTPERLLLPRFNVAADLYRVGEGRFSLVRRGGDTRTSQLGQEDGSEFSWGLCCSSVNPSG